MARRASCFASSSAETEKEKKEKMKQDPRPSVSDIIHDSPDRVSKPMLVETYRTGYAGPQDIFASWSLAPFSFAQIFYSARFLRCSILTLFVNIFSDLFLHFSIPFIPFSLALRLERRIWNGFPSPSPTPATFRVWVIFRDQEDPFGVRRALTCHNMPRIRGTYPYCK